MSQKSDDPSPGPASAEAAVTVEDGRWLDLLGVPDEAAAAGLLQPLARAALAAGGWARPAELGIVLSDDAAVRAFNRDYRGVDRPTNVLSFALEDAAGPSGPGPAALGDVVLAFDTVAREAAEQKLAPRDHACHLVAHGVLHLIGYVHEEEAEAESMERLEARVLAAFGIGDPYADASGASGTASPGRSP
jgi:probable rRNA maturation factor